MNGVIIGGVKDIRMVESGTFSITLDATRGIAQVPSQNIPTLSDYECIGMFLCNFNSAEFSTAQMPPTCIWYKQGNIPYILGTPGKTYNVSIYGIFIKRG